MYASHPFAGCFNTFKARGEHAGVRGEAGRRLAPRGVPAPATHAALSAGCGRRPCGMRPAALLLPGDAAGFAGHCCSPRSSLPPRSSAHTSSRQKASCKRPRRILKLLELINLKKV